MAFYGERFRRPDEEDIWEELRQMLLNPPSEQEIALKKQQEQAWIDSILNKAFPENPKPQSEPYLRYEDLLLPEDAEKYRQKQMSQSLTGFASPIGQNNQMSNTKAQQPPNQPTNLVNTNNNLVQDIDNTQTKVSSLSNLGTAKLQQKVPQQVDNRGLKNNNIAFEKQYYVPNEPLKATIIKDNIITPYNNEIENNPNLTEEEKFSKKIDVYNIHQQAKAREKVIEQKDIANKAKIFGKELLPFAIPNILPAKVTAKTTKILEPIVNKPLSKVGSKIKDNIIEDFAKNVYSSPINSSIEAIDEKKNVAKTILENYPKDIAESFILNSLRTHRDKNKIKKHIESSIDTWNTRQQRKQQEKSLQYYNDYIKDTSKDIGLEDWLEELLRKRK